MAEKTLTQIGDEMQSILNRIIVAVERKGIRLNHEEYTALLEGKSAIKEWIALRTSKHACVNRQDHECACLGEECALAKGMFPTSAKD